MFELINQARALGKGMWKFRWPAVVVAWVVAAIGVIAVMRIPDQYEASARIYVDTQTILKPLLAGLTVQPDIDQQVSMLSRTLISRPNVEKLIRMADLDLKNQSKSQQEALIEQLTGALQIKSAARDNLYLLSYRDSNADQAKRAVQSLVSIFVESSLGVSRKDTDSAKTFLNEQIKAYRTKLEDAEAKLKDFRVRNLDYSTEGKDSATRLGDIAAQLDRAKLELREAENARDAAKAAMVAESSQANTATKSLLQESAVSVATPEVDARLDLQRRNLDALLQRYTDQHPEVVSTRRLIKDLEEQKKKQVAELRQTQLSAPVGAGGATGSLAYQEMGRVLANSEVQVAALRARVSEYASRYDQARGSLRTAPQVDAEMMQLNRDYAIHKKNYEDLVARRESAVMSGDLDTAAGMADFRVIDPPRVSPKPVYPNRPLLLPLALAAALVAGLLFAFAASQLRPVFYTASELRAKTDLPLLGVVSMVLSDGQRRKERVDMMRFGAATAALVGVFLIGMPVMSLFSGQ